MSVPFSQARFRRDAYRRVDRPTHPGGGLVRIYFHPLICWCGKSYQTWTGYLRCIERHQRGL